jgi:hypothetical protein
LLLAVLALAVWCAPQAGAASRRSFFGVSGGLTDQTSITALSRGPVEFFRTDAPWPNAEPDPPTAGHRYQWDTFDGIAERLARAGLTWYPILDYSPSWATTAPGNPMAAPRDAGEFAAYAAAFAARYGVSGVFWHERPDVPAHPVRIYEIWNEPNAETFWHQPSPAAYLTLYRQVHQAIRQRDPHARVVVGGLLDSGTVSALGFLERMHASRELDAVGWHPYLDPVDIAPRLRVLRRTLNRAGATRTPIEITELDTFQMPDDQGTRAARWSAFLAWAARYLPASGYRVTRLIPYLWSDPTALSPTATVQGWLTLTDQAGTPNRLGRRFLQVAATQRDGRAAGVGKHL